MANFDVVRKKISIKDVRHAQHKDFLRRLSQRAHRLHRLRVAWSAVLTVGFVLFSGVSIWQHQARALEYTAVQQAELQKVRLHALTRFNNLPVESVDPKTDSIVEYLADKKSPLVDYAGIIARSPNYKLLIGIAQAETNLCKKTLSNNCWGIGPGSPFYYDDIKFSLYYADYLIEKYESLGMDTPEKMVRTYVGYHNPTWIEAINEVFYDLEVRGL
ncbi:MAG: hypothetical protein A2826_01635 [Candidatus Doudnabacteria bacterium RIFCSPHIGHO2_01_FULL_43_23]|uniref:Uncharacterized protein n=1 Tax=Candidatus Doudnabacteria bacterium RIFCSPHIGHO2_01_FULL_43_23 TaxID=1817822 RepID=A0A1F5NSI8_9BACT|nr:MAG: hypothetical protein A2826_01635 [Candidatus Doudnabacteria bacterium RIFCSPHIGHO2_01_FULL_43_23]